MKPTILFIYDYFYPGFKAGGPIQSLINLITTIQEKYNCVVLTSAYDLNEKKPYDIINIDNWNRVLLPDAENAIAVYYYDRKSYGYGFYKRFLKHLNPEFVYINGLYTFPYTIIPLVASLTTPWKRCRHIVAPRGMLQPSSYAERWLKKVAYFWFLKVLGVPAKVFWHATDENEALDIQDTFKKIKGVTVCPNIPRNPVTDIKTINKQSGEIRLVYLSLIAEKKNLHLVIDTILKLNDPRISLDVYGPAKDPAYFRQCMEKIESSNGLISYKGPVQPELVQQTLEQYHALILLSKGENFGHAIYESLSVGRPVIISRFTAWTHVGNSNAGWVIDIENVDSCTSELKKIADTSSDLYQVYCENARQAAVEYRTRNNFLHIYCNLFSNN